MYFACAADPVDAIKNIAVDMTMHEPARFVARQMTAAGQPAWLYRFGYVAANAELMMFTPDAAAVVQADPWKSRLDLIERAVEAQVARPQ